MTIYKGIVQKGTKRASALGFPTLNIPLEDDTVSGIYAARVEVGGEIYAAAVYADQRRKLLEAYLLDFADTMQATEITIMLGKKIRENQTFDNDAALRAAITSDVENTRKFFEDTI